MTYHNPIIPGFHPDPSICRVGEDYYLATSSFEYFPGVPMWHSRDLVHWRQTGHCLTRDSQVDLGQVDSSCGIFAPTLRYHDGRFYLVTTDVFGGKGHFYVWTDDPAGEWSDPISQPGDGFDPDLFFDDDGTVWFTWKAWEEPGDYVRQIDLATGEALSADTCIWTGFEDGHAEGPHLYKINGLYYLLVAEGGTHRGHMVVIARSESVTGPYVSCPHNPILTHRNRVLHPIQATGHGDLVQDHLGNWWIVFLGIRLSGWGGSTHHLGRETFLAPVTWTDDGWPLVNGGQPIELEMDGPLPPAQPWPAQPERDDFDADILALSWNYRRNPEPACYSLTDRPGWLRLTGTAATLDTAKGMLTFLGRRQQHFACMATARLQFDPQVDGEEAGLTVYQKETHHYEIAVAKLDGERQLIVRRRIGDLVAIVARRPLATDDVTLRIVAEPATYHLEYALGEGEFTRLASGEAQYLSSEVAHTFTGVYFGLYATGNGREGVTPAWVNWFAYEENTLG